jgi:LPS export ABC transporter protein LptC
MRGAFAGLVFPIACAFASAPAWSSTPSPELEVGGMTFVSSRDSVNELVLRAQTATFEPDTEVAHLETVHATVNGSDEGSGFEVRCDRGELDLQTNDFYAEGNVRGRTDGGREFSSAWVRYDHEEGVLFTDAPVLITEQGGTYRGGGFRYYVRERRFRMLGGASVVTQP